MISEADLENFDGVSAGKVARSIEGVDLDRHGVLIVFIFHQYTIGLGQEFMAFTDDREDIHSFLLTGLSHLTCSDFILHAS